MIDETLLPEMPLEDKRALDLAYYKLHKQRLRKDPIYRSRYVGALSREKRRRSNRWRRW